MSIYKRKIDDQMLNPLKNNIINYLSGKGIKNYSFFLDNMNVIKGFYVENLIDRLIGAMISRPDEISIDKMFVEEDKNGNNIIFKKKIEKLIKSQLTHELVHSAARYKDSKGEYFTGINKDKNKVALNEGLTQMITERITGFVVSPNNDKYRDLKKYAKILGDTLGDEAILNTYFNRTNDLPKGCEELSGDSNFYEKLNLHMTFLHNMQKNVNKQYHGGIKQKQYNEMKALIIKELCVNIIVPKLKTLPEKEQKQYIATMLEDVKDDTEFSKMLQNGIVNFYNMDEHTFNYRKQMLTEKLSEKEKALDTAKLFSTISMEQIVKGIEFEDNGTMKLHKVYRIDNSHQISGETLAKLINENESIKEEIYAAKYNSTLKNKVGFENKVKQIIENGETLSLGKVTNSRKKEIMSAFKIQAKKDGYCILNSIQECENGNSINLDAFELPKRNEQYSFENIKNVYDRFELKERDDYELGSTTYVIDKKTGKEVFDLDLQDVVRFADLWVRATGVKTDSQDKYGSEKYSFNEQSDAIYNILTDSISTQMKQNGQIDTKEVFEQISTYPYKYSKQIATTLLKDSEDLRTIYKFIEKTLPEKNLETEISKPANETVFEKDYSDKSDRQAEKIVGYFTPKDVNKSAISKGIGRTEISELFTNIKNQINTRIQDKRNIDRMGN